MSLPSDMADLLAFAAAEDPPRDRVLEALRRVMGAKPRAPVPENWDRGQSASAAICSAPNIAIPASVAGSPSVATGSAKRSARPLSSLNRSSCGSARHQKAWRNMDILAADAGKCVVSQ